MIKLESIVEDLKALPPNRLASAADFIHKLRTTSDAERSAIIDRTAGSLTPEEQARIHAALINEAERLRNMAVEFGQTEPIASPVGAG